MNTHAHYLQKILTASVYDVAVETPLQLASGLSAQLKNNIWLKREDLQPVFSFKIRGAYNMMASLSADLLAKGVITASAGNHAQGVALSSQKLGCKATIVMPETTPKIKVNAVKARGGNVVLAGQSFTDAYEHAMTLAKTSGMTYIPPFDHPMVIAGQGTIGMEIIRQHNKPIDAIFVPVGGGGLVAGVVAYIKNVRPEIKVIGVETEDAASMKAALEHGSPVTLPEVGIFADGTAVKRVGDETFQICRDLLDEVILVTTDDVCVALKDIYDNIRSITEPSGALGLAGLKAYIKREQCTEKTLIAVNSGANMDFHRLRFVSEQIQKNEEKAQ
ncbi:threonine ammonia-lyase, biosynthetic [Dichelobacter nodosus]|uniref:L-threonine dehydratase n=1 Tax=Dichelobacter nodosus (strain VCS1703A) TaxID=246195 RepID=A5EW52_DICNV|nr:threonine ammonia-lyase, biosynthetic [Dichelobacter nodosus]ABQ14180.1 threonine dehydratase [Dichelobacter nodosus VCS1703A]AXM45226.1 threonine ammonia-lyase, biosynthetic [Dichelobacter nodosus]TGA64379.1 threonine ammonia-lyase, biosynthetic [Dichelobacter nodosus]